MSRTIDEKVVEMRFDNKDFERNVSQSMSTLDKLKSALDFSGAGKAFEGISSAAGHIDFGGLSDGLSHVTDGFTNLGEIAIGSIKKIASTITDFVGGELVSLAKGLSIDNIDAGFAKYEKKGKSVQTIMNATGQSIEEVSEQLDKLNWYTDETSYDFAEMVATIGKFTASGVSLEDAVTSMQGIANWAGISGAEKTQANMAFYNLAQALGLGYVGAGDYRSIMNAGMDTQQFRQMAIEEALKAGTLAYDETEEGLQRLVAIDKETGEIIYANEKEGEKLYVDAQNFYSTLTKGKWFDSEVLSNVLDLYGRFSEKLHSFYEEIETTSGLSFTSSELIEYIEQFRDGTIDLDEVVRETGMSAERLTEIFSELGSKEYELSMQAFQASSEYRTFNDAIESTKDAVSTGLMNTFELIFGNYEEAKALWSAVGNELYDIFAQPIADMNKLLKVWKNEGGRTGFIEAIANLYTAARSLVDPITEAWQAIFPTITADDLLEITEKFRAFTEQLLLSDEQMERLGQTAERIFGFFKSAGSVIGDLFGAFSSGFGSKASGLFDTITGAIDFAADHLYAFSRQFDSLKNLFELYRNGAVNLEKVVNKAREQHSVLSSVVDVYLKLKDTVGIVGETLGRVFDLSAFVKDGALSFGSIIDGLASKLTTLLGGIVEIVHVWTGIDIARIADVIRSLIFDASEGLKGLIGEVSSFVSEFLSLKDTVDAFNAAGGGFSGVLAVISDKLQIVGGLIASLAQKTTGLDISGLVYIFSGSIARIGEIFKWLATNPAWEEIKAKLSEIKTAFVDRFGDINDFFAPVVKFMMERWYDFVDSLSMLTGFSSNGTEGFFAVLKSGLDTLKEFVQTSSALEFVVNLFKSVISVVSDHAADFLSLRDTIVVFKEAGGGLGGVLSVIADKLGIVFDAVADLIQETTGIDIHAIGEVAAKVFPYVETVVVKASDAVKGFFGLFKKEGTGGIEKTGEDTEKTFTPIQTFFNGLKSLFGGLLVVAEKLKPVFEAILGEVGKVLQTIGGAIKNTFENMDLSSALDLIGKGIKIAIGGGLAKLLHSLSNPLDKFSGIMKGVKDVLDGVQGCFEAWQKKLKSEILMKLAGAIAVLTLSIVVLSGIDSGKLKVALAAITAMMVELIGAMGITDEIVSGKKKLGEMGLMMLEMSAALLLASVALKKVGSLEWDQVQQGLGAMLSALAMMTIAMIALDKYAGKSGEAVANGFAMIEMALALIMVGSVLKKVGSLEWNQLQQGLGGMLLSLAMMTIAMIALDKFAGEHGGAVGNGFAMIEMALALLMVGSVLKNIGSLEWEQINQGLGSMLASLAMMTIALIALEKFGGSTIANASSVVILAVALKIIANDLRSFGDMEWPSIIKGLVAMGIALAEVAAVSIVMNKLAGGGMTILSAVGIAAMAAALILLAVPLKMLGSMSLGEVVKSLIAVGGALLAIGLLGTVFGSMVLQIVLFSAAVATMAGALMLLVPSLMLLGTMSLGGLIKSLVAMAGAFLTIGILGTIFGAVAPMILLFSAAIAIMAGALMLLIPSLMLLGTMSLGEIVKSLVAMGGAFLTIGILGTIFGAVAPMILLFSAAVATMAGALMLLTPSLMLLGTMSLGEIIKSLLIMAGAFAIIGVAGLVLGPVIPLIIALSAAIAILGVATLAIGAGLALFASGLSLVATVGSAGISVLILAITSIIGLIPLLLTQVSRAIITVIKIIGDNAVVIAETVVKVAGAILDAAQELIPKLVETVVTIIDEVLKTIAEHSDSIIESVATIMLNLLNGVAEYLPDFIQAGIDIVLSLIEGLGDGLVENTERAKEAFDKLFSSIIESILIFLGVDQDKAQKFVEIAGDMISGLVSGITEFATDILSAVGNLMNDIIEKIKGKLPDIKEAGRNVGEGIKNGLTTAKDKVVSAAKTVGNAVLNTLDKVFDAHSPSKETEEDGDNLIDGLVGSMDRGSDKAVNSAENLGDKILGTLKDKFNYNDIADFFGGNFEDLFASFISTNGTDGSFEDIMSSFLSQYGMDSYDMNGLLAEEGVEGFANTYTSQMEAYAPEIYDLNASVANAGADGFTGQYTARMEEYVPEAYATAGDIGSTSVYGYADSVISTTDEVKPTVQTAMEELSDATTTPIEKGLTEMLSYAEWVAKEYPKGIGEEFSTPVFDFTDLYANMQGGQLEALLSTFDELDEAGRKNLIRAYGLGEQGGNEDLANYLQWYWKNEPIRMQNEEAIARAQEGYQVYLEEQKALQEAQAVQSQQQYEGVQQIAADMQTRTDEFNAKYLAVVEEIKMNVAALREELDGVHATISELNNMDVYIDSDSLVGATAEKYDQALGNLAKIGRRVTR